MPTPNQHTTQIQANTVTRAKLTVENREIMNAVIDQESITPPPASDTPDNNTPPSETQKQMPGTSDNLSQGPSSTEVAQFVQQSASRIIPWTTLQQKRNELPLDNTNWNMVKSNQKDLFRRQLLMRYGFVENSSNATSINPFNFNHNENEWQNIIQLEAVVEFFINFRDPHKPSSAENPPVIGENLPNTPNSENYTRVNLEENPMIPEWAGDTYGLGSYHIVIIDSFGGRCNNINWSIPPNSNRDSISLANSVINLRVNRHFDTLYIQGPNNDTSNRLKRIFRIGQMTNNTPVVCTLDRPVPTEFGDSGSCYISAGICNTMPDNLNSNMAFQSTYSNNHYYDNYDGVMFLIRNGRVLQIQKICSYPSWAYRNDLQKGAAIRGNKRYLFFSKKSESSDFRNYTFGITEVLNRQRSNGRIIENRLTQPMEGRTYMAENVAGRSKDHIWLHYGRVGDQENNSSQGCLVTPGVYLIRRKMIQLYQGQVGESANYLTSLADKVTHTDSVSFYHHINGLPANQWADIIYGNLWLIRPDEKPLSQY